MQRHKTRVIRVLLPFTLIPFVLIAALSCATAPPVQTEEDVRGVTALAAAGETELLTEQSHIPFLFDGELLVRSRDIADMWRLLVSTGLFSGEVVVGAISAVGFESYTIFADSKQVEIFFSKYLSEYARTAVIDTPAARVTLLLDGKSEGYSRIAGMRLDAR